MEAKLEIGDWLGWTTGTKIYWYKVKKIEKTLILIYVASMPIWHSLESIMQNKYVIKATTKEKLAYNLKTKLIVYDNMD